MIKIPKHPLPMFDNWTTKEVEDYFDDLAELSNTSLNHDDYNMVASEIRRTARELKFRKHKNFYERQEAYLRANPDGMPF